MNLIHCKQITIAFVLSLFIAYTANAQSSTVTLDFKDAPLGSVLESIEKQTKKSFFYEDNLINLEEKINISVKDADLKSVIDKLFGGRLVFSQTDQHIVLKTLPANNTELEGNNPTTIVAQPERRAEKPIEKMTGTNNTVSQGTITVRGTVYDDEGFSLPGATIVAKGTTKKHTTSDMEGKFELQNIDANATLSVSFMGFTTQDVPLNGRAKVEVKLVTEAVKLDDVVIIGNIERRKESFTGATATVTGDALKQIGTQNLVQNLQSLDPSFVVLDNSLAGANPNVMPTIEIRGQTAINIEDVEDRFKTDPNQPLFILNGFETTLQKIIDLDFNRVSSVTILKDAASTAMYGSRAANGVVVVETIKGKPGRFKVNYTGDYSVQVPDLTSYNMMNASEKLQFEVLSGRYLYNNTGVITSGSAAQAQSNLDALYNKHLAEVERGVDTYWLSDPVRTAFTNRQSIRVSGGSNEITIDANLSYRNAPGVMNGSKRDSWSGGVDLAYNRGQFSVINYLSVSGYTAIESPYGSFSDYVKTNPYYRKTDENGEYPRYLEEVVSNGATDSKAYKVANPLYNAMLNSKDESKNTSIENNFQAIWKFYQGMQLQGSLRLSSEKTNTTKFTPPENTLYDEVASDKKGYYYGSEYDRFIYQARMMYVWNNTIKKHNYTINAQGELEGNEYTNLYTEAQGFPYGTNGSPSFASSYLVDGKPGYINSVFRRVSLLLSGNYSFNDRYLLDVSYRLDGSTAFGAAKKYTPMWGTGIGWNIHNETFMKDVHWINQFRLRANIGETGNQNLTNIVSTSIYTYNSGSNRFGTGTTLNKLGNPNIAWQKTRTGSINLDLSLFDSRLVTEFSVYQKYTNPLVVPVDQAPSTGVSSYYMSLGNLTTEGFEFKVTYAIIRNLEERINWRVQAFGSVLRSIYGGFSNQLDGMNNNSTSLLQYRDGYSYHDIWAVRSLGIDPATGQELFLNKNGEPTFIYDAANRVVVGNTNPDLYGTISSLLTFKRLTFNFTLRYSLGGNVFNSVLYDKVENISFANIAYNQDKRALYERWQKPGDVTEFKSISLTSSTPMSSRFVQTENYLSGESLNIGWRFEKTNWIKALGMEQLNLNASVNNFFRISTVKTERGTNYPFARTFSLSINAIF